MQRDSQPLVVDRASASVKLDSEAMADWARSKRVFISSAMDDQMKPYRLEAASTVRALGAEPVWFEEFGGRDQDPAQAYLTEVDSSDIYAGILGTRYGRQGRNGFSATHDEYLRATQRSLRVSVWSLDVPDMEGHQRSFLDEVRSVYTTETVADPAQFRARLIDRLQRIASEDASPWVKLGDLLFRAHRIVADPNVTTIEARIKDGDVASALLALRERRWGRDLHLTFGDSTGEVQVKEIRTVLEAGTSQKLMMTFEHRPEYARSRPGYQTSASFSGRAYSPTELTELAVADQLLGQTFPQDLRFSRPQIPQFVDLIRNAGLSEEAIRPILRILFVEALVGSGRAERITRLALGPRTPTGRHAVVEWRPTAESGETQRLGRVEGRVDF